MPGGFQSHFCPSRRAAPAKPRRQLQARTQSKSKHSARGPGGHAVPIDSARAGSHNVAALRPGLDRSRNRMSPGLYFLLIQFSREPRNRRFERRIDGLLFQFRLPNYVHARHPLLLQQTKFRWCVPRYHAPNFGAVFRDSFSAQEGCAQAPVQKAAIDEQASPSCPAMPHPGRPGAFHLGDSRKPRFTQTLAHKPALPGLVISLLFICLACSAWVALTYRRFQGSAASTAAPRGSSRGWRRSRTGVFQEAPQARSAPRGNSRA